MALKYAPGTRAYLATLAPRPRKALRQALQRLERDARHDQLDIKLLTISRPHRFFRLRIGSYRIVYSPQPNATYVWRTFHRTEGYDWIDPIQSQPKGANDPPDA